VWTVLDVHPQTQISVTWREKKHIKVTRSRGVAAPASSCSRVRIIELSPPSGDLARFTLGTLGDPLSTETTEST
jgi:hypothetical protein